MVSLKFSLLHSEVPRELLQISWERYHGDYHSTSIQELTIEILLEVKPEKIRQKRLRVQKATDKETRLKNKTDKKETRLKNKTIEIFLEVKPEKNQTKKSKSSNSNR